MLTKNGIILIVTVSLFVYLIFTIILANGFLEVLHGEDSVLDKKPLKKICGMSIPKFIFLLVVILYTVGWFFGYGLLQDYVSKQDKTSKIVEERTITDFSIERVLNYEVRNHGDLTKYFIVSYRFLGRNLYAHKSAESFVIGDENKITMTHYINKWEGDNYWIDSEIEVTPEVAEFLHFDLTAPVEVKDGIGYGESYSGEKILDIKDGNLEEK